MLVKITTRSRLWTAQGKLLQLRKVKNLPVKVLDSMERILWFDNFQYPLLPINATFRVDRIHVGDKLSEILTKIGSDMVHEQICHSSSLLFWIFFRGRRRGRRSVHYGSDIIFCLRHCMYDELVAEVHCTVYALIPNVRSFSVDVIFCFRSLRYVFYRPFLIPNFWMFILPQFFYL